MYPEGLQGQGPLCIAFVLVCASVESTLTQTMVCSADHGLHHACHDTLVRICVALGRSIEGITPSTCKFSLLFSGQVIDVDVDEIDETWRLSWL